MRSLNERNGSLRNRTGLLGGEFRNAAGLVQLATSKDCLACRLELCHFALFWPPQRHFPAATDCQRHHGHIPSWEAVLEALGDA